MNRVRVRTAVAMATLAAIAGSVRAGEEVETFDGGVFTNPFFQHEIEYRCCWEILQFQGEWMLHFEPNTDKVTFDLREGEKVFSVSVTVEDYEGGFRGDAPTSAVIVRGANGDFALLLASEIGRREVLTADIHTPGRLTGEPIGEIVEVMFSAANEGNSVFPERVGAYFDDIRVVTTGGIPCDAIGRLRGKCKPSGKVTAKVKLRTRDYDGQTVTVGLDGTPVELGIAGRKAKHKQCCFEGPVALTLVDPRSCVAPVQVDCG